MKNKAPLHPLVEQLVKLGVDITIGYDKEKSRFTYHLNTGAKSDMNAYTTKGGTLFIETRYGPHEVETFEELCKVFDGCVTSFCHYQWSEAMAECGHWPDKNYRPFP